MISKEDLRKRLQEALSHCVGEPMDKQQLVNIIAGVVTEINNPHLELIKDSMMVEWGFGSAIALEKKLKSASDEDVALANERTGGASRFLYLEDLRRKGNLKDWKVGSENLTEDGNDVNLLVQPIKPLDFIKMEFILSEKE